MKIITRTLRSGIAMLLAVSLTVGMLPAVAHASGTADEKEPIV